MSSCGATKPHVVLVPYPAQGHITPFMQLAKLLHSKGVHITFLNTEFIHTRLIRSKGSDFVKGLPDFCFETIPDGLPPLDHKARLDIPTLSESIRNNCVVPFVELVNKLNSLSEVPLVSCIISDGVIASFGINVGELLGIKVVQFWTASACSLVAYLQFSELRNRGIIPFKDESFMIDGTLDTKLDWIPGMTNIRLKDIPSFIRTTNPKEIMVDNMVLEVESCLKSSIIINTFDDLEYQVLEVLASWAPNIYSIGPLSLLSKQFTVTKSISLKSTLWTEDENCLAWLDKKEPNSVVYVNYGSVATMSKQHLEEFAWGLANSKHPFLWIVRPDIVMDGSSILPDEFFEEIKDRGLVATWCPQDRVLAHPSLAVFLTHCGWNSTLETICEGVSVICWPYFADQQTNCRYACTTWGIGVEVDNDVKRDKIEGLVKEMMEGVEGKRRKEMALEWKKKAEVATSIGGSSYDNFERLIKEL